MPSSSPRCAQFPRAQDKVHFYIKLKELRDQMKGSATGHEVVETEYSFDLQLAKGKWHNSPQLHGTAGKQTCLLGICISGQIFAVFFNMSLFCRGCKEDCNQRRASGSRV